MDIIIYGSLHGAAKRYAEGLAERTGLKAVDYKEVDSLGIPPQLYDEKKVFHLRGAIDYSQLELKYRILMKMMYSQASKLPEEKLTSEFKAVLATYGQKVDYVDLNSMEPLIDAITSQNGIPIH
jgi:hypothetical protein